jgi:hypothetical protein
MTNIWTPAGAGRLTRRGRSLVDASASEADAYLMRRCLAGLPYVERSGEPLRPLSPALWARLREEP